MSKKSSKHKMDITKFKAVICRQCQVCAKGFNPKFCFRTLYKRNPDKFISVIKYKLDENMSYVKQFTKLSLEELFNSMVAMTVFKTVFCSKEICVGCKITPSEIGACLTRFKMQTEGDRRLKTSGTTFKIEKKQTKEIPKVTIFMSDNPEFRAEVKRILENNNQQPDKDRGSERIVEGLSSYNTQTQQSSIY